MPDIFGLNSDIPGKSAETRWVLACWGALALGVAVVFTLGLSNDVIGAQAASMAGLFLAGAATLSGAFIGFLFGIPRSKQGAGPVAGAAGAEEREYQENTNLEQISDWLTKIIVGITLVQFNEIRGIVVEAGNRFGPALLPADAGVGQAVGVALIIYFFIVGFLFGYLWTRIHMEYVLRWQSVQSSVEITEILERKREQENDVDAEAFEMTDSYLELAADPTAPEFANIEQKVAASSLIARTMIFERARETRRDAWRKPIGDPERTLVDRTIPIFRGLVAAAPNQYHRNYGQLGYALVKSTRPDWEAAKAAFERAIVLRGKGEKSGTGYYEFNLAVTHINLDANFHEGKPSEPDTRARIVALLDEGRTVIDLHGEDVIVAWAKLNKYKI